MTSAVGILLATCLAGSLAFPSPDTDVSQFFGHSDPTGRIVGGTPADSAPFMVALSTGMIARSLLCGGSLVGRRQVLTAAHCVAAVFSGGSLASSLRGTVGTNRWNSGGTHYNFARNISHPHYVAGPIKNDIALLVTTTDVALTNAVRLVALSYDFVGGNVGTTVYGWGRIRQGGQSSATLLQLNKNTIDGNRCVEDVARRAQELNLRPPPVEPHIEICTFHSANHGTCHGDSGSPLVRRSSGQQVGLVSWGLPCARGAPDMFVRVSAYRSWLTSNL